MGWFRCPECAAINPTSWKDCWYCGVGFLRNDSLIESNEILTEYVGCPSCQRLVEWGSMTCLWCGRDFAPAVWDNSEPWEWPDCVEILFPDLDVETLAYDSVMICCNLPVDLCRCPVTEQVDYRDAFELDEYPYFGYLDIESEDSCEGCWRKNTSACLPLRETLRALKHEGFRHPQLARCNDYSLLPEHLAKELSLDVGV